jgi:hypothetical protein
LFSLTVERRLGPNWTASISGIRSLTVKQYQSFDSNAPAPFPRTQPGQMRSGVEADRSRPISVLNGIPVRQVQVTQNSGISRYHGLHMSLARRFAKRYQIEASYVYSQNLTNASNDHNFAAPNEWSDVGRAEWGPSEFWQRNRFVAHGTANLPWNAQLSMVATLASGVPVNATTGVDNNGDSTVRDRPPFFSRHGFVGPRQTTFDLSLGKPVSLGESAKLELRTEIYNLFNGSNFHRLNGVWGNGATPLPTFLAPQAGITAADPGRQFTFVARFLF